MKIKPSRGKAFVRLHRDEAKSKGGILLPESARGDKSEGTVVGVGEGKLLECGIVSPPPVVVGDEVIMPQYGGSEVKPLGWEGDGEGRMVIVDTDSILAVVEK